MTLGKKAFICLWVQKCQAIVHSYDSGPMLKEKITASRSCEGGVIHFMEDRKREHVLVAFLLMSMTEASERMEG